MAIAQTDEVAGHGVDSCRARVGQPPLKPGSRLPEVLQEEVVQARRVPGAYLHNSQSIFRKLAVLQGMHLAYKLRSGQPYSPQMASPRAN